MPAQQRGDALGIECHPVLHRTTCSSPATTPRGCTPTYRIDLFDLFTGPVPRSLYPSYTDGRLEEHSP